MNGAFSFKKNFWVSVEELLNVEELVSVDEAPFTW